MKTNFPCQIIFGLIVTLFLIPYASGEAEPSYNDLLRNFQNPNHAVWGEVPLWWWEGDPMTKERVTWQLETLAAKGVKSVCPIQRSPGRCDPQSFDPDWWEMFAYVHQECKRLGMTLWAYDQVGYGHYGWLEKAAAKVQDNRTRQIKFLTADANPNKSIQLKIPDGDVIAARAYPIQNNLADDKSSKDLRKSIQNKELQWTPESGNWRVTVSVAVPHVSFYLSEKSAETFIDMFYGKTERLLGKDAMGKSFVGIFQDEHPPTPRDIYTRELAKTFRKRSKYDIGRAIPALHFDVGPLTPKYRTDFFDAYLALDEKSYWKRVFDWTNDRNLLTSYDNWGRQNIYRQSQGYIDYFRTQRWFSAPGYDDYGQHPLDRRNYYDTKIAASLARLYKRPRVWSEAFHSSGWGRTTDQTLTWLSVNYAWGANLYDEHGLYYSTRASSWEHAAPDPHWRQPYWRYYKHLSDWVARMSYLMSQGNHVVDVAVHYPVVSLLAGEAPGQKGPDYNQYMKISRLLYDAGMDNDIIDDDSILAGRVKDGKFLVAGNEYRALVFGPETTMRQSVLEQAQRLVDSGGIVFFSGKIPTATVEGGRQDPDLTKRIKKLFQLNRIKNELLTIPSAKGGFVGFVPQKEMNTIPNLLTYDASLDRDFIAQGGKVYIQHRRIKDTHVYLVQNTETQDINLKARCRVDGMCELWDPFTGGIRAVDRFERKDGYTHIEQRMEGNMAYVFIFSPGDKTSYRNPAALAKATTKPLSPDWTFSTLATRDNRWGEFRWPPSKEQIGPEVRSFRYREESEKPGIDLGWHKPTCNDKDWTAARYSIGPYWLYLAVLPEDFKIGSQFLADLDQIASSDIVAYKNKNYAWKPVEFSQTIGLAKPMPWGGHSGYPDGAVDQNFIDVPQGKKILFTRIHSPKNQRLGLRVELRNSKARLWVNAQEQPFEDAIGNLPLNQGVNTILLELPDGGKGRLFVQKTPPSVMTMAQAAQGRIQPGLKAASWIWVGTSDACYLRKTFPLNQLPAEARLTVTADNGYRLFVNGVKIEEEIGPWANWKVPESFNIAAHLRKGENVIAAWGQDLGAEEGFILALKARFENGSQFDLKTDETWKGTTTEHDNWQQIGFKDEDWQRVTDLGKMGVAPWGLQAMQNIGIATEPKRRLAIHMPSPYLDCFDEVPDIVYDVKSKTQKRIGWYRFEAPPGLKQLTLPTDAKAQVWVNGIAASVRNGIAHIDPSPQAISKVAVRLEMTPGAYGGAAFTLPLGLTLEGGKIQPGEWKNFALPTYSGIGVYQQTITISPKEINNRIVLNLGQVLVAAEVLVNGKPAGVRLARPFKFDITRLLHPGENTIEVRVANTIAPHYTVTNKVHNLGPTASGLLGPVQLTLFSR
jgi:glycosyl hydrolase family 106( putative alpha-L-rhamnosidase)/glycosyl hydrolase family 2